MSARRKARKSIRRGHFVAHRRRVVDRLDHGIVVTPKNRIIGAPKVATHFSPKLPAKYRRVHYGISNIVANSPAARGKARRRGPGSIVPSLIGIGAPGRRQQRVLASELVIRAAAEVVSHVMSGLFEDNVLGQTCLGLGEADHHAARIVSGGGDVAPSQIDPP